ncbi:PAS domain S-box protein [Roseiconus nitratireducens]|uniref:PAS domain S-box protein n=1 Tax=Roseiconus nitratireducens TaxID=2605748 RepID=UPI0013754EF3|nr:PAS domain S-box protein [Roseiconus nitratireducens]
MDANTTQFLRGGYAVLAAILASLVAIADWYWQGAGAIAVLYVGVVIVASQSRNAAVVLVSAAACVVLLLLVGALNPVAEQFVARLLIALTIGAVTLLSLQWLRLRSSQLRRVAIDQRWASDIEETHRERDSKSRELTSLVEQLNAERQKLALSEERTRLLLNSAAEGIYGLDNEGNCTFANTACAEMLGYQSADLLLGKNMHALTHHTRDGGEVYPIGECQISHAFLRGTSAHLEEETFWRRDGSSFPAECWSHPIYENDQLIGAVVTFTDVTERKRLQEALKRDNEELERVVSVRNSDLAMARDRLELALTAGNVGLWDWNARTNKVYYSATYKKQLGYPHDVQWNHFSHWESQLHPDDFDVAHERVNEYFEHRTNEYKSIFRLRCKDGSYRWILAQGDATFDEQGLPMRMIGVHVDITERIENERELKRLNHELERANEALQESNVQLQQFAYVASHDLQTPLRGITGFAQFLRTDYEGQFDEKADDYMRRIVEAAKRMQRMIDDLLIYCRVESRAAPFERTDLNDIVNDALALLDASIEERGAEIQCATLPSIDCDRSQILQLLLNLIGNAIKYCRDKPRVQIDADVGPERCLISIRDNGIGIGEEHLERIFEIFRRLHTREAYPGTGIGLAVCRRIVRRHGGKIWAESVDGQGSTFFVELPINPLHAPAVEASFGDQNPETTEPAGRASRNASDGGTTGQAISPPARPPEVPQHSGRHSGAPLDGERLQNG